VKGGITFHFRQFFAPDNYLAAIGLDYFKKGLTTIYAKNKGSGEFDSVLFRGADEYINTIIGGLKEKVSEPLPEDPSLEPIVQGEFENR